MESQVFNIELFDMSAERISTEYPATCVLTLRGGYVGLSFDYNSEEAVDEDKLTWEPRRWRQSSAYRSDQLSAVHFYYINSEKCWRLQLEFNGVAAPIDLNFRKRSQGHPIYEACCNYMLIHFKSLVP